MSDTLGTGVVAQDGTQIAAGKNTNAVRYTGEIVANGGNISTCYANRQSQLAGGKPIYSCSGNTSVQMGGTCGQTQTCKQWTTTLRREALGRAELHAAFEELLAFYAKATFDDEEAGDTEDATVALGTSRTPNGRIFAPLWQRVGVSAQGDISSAIADVLAATCQPKTAVDRSRPLYPGANKAAG